MLLEGQGHQHTGELVRKAEVPAPPPASEAEVAFPHDHTWCALSFSFEKHSFFFHLLSHPLLHPFSKAKGMRVCIWSMYRHSLLPEEKCIRGRRMGQKTWHHLPCTGTWKWSEDEFLKLASKCSSLVYRKLQKACKGSSRPFLSPVHSPPSSRPIQGARPSVRAQLQSSSPPPAPSPSFPQSSFCPPFMPGDRLSLKVPGLQYKKAPKSLNVRIKSILFIKYSPRETLK